MSARPVPVSPLLSRIIFIVVVTTFGVLLALVFLLGLMVSLA